MPGKKGNRVVYYVSIIIILLFWGCSVEQTHKTLTFFFDGVDKTVFFNAYLSTDSLSKDAIARREGLLKKVRPDLCVHQPFKEKKCDKCHTPDKRLLMPMPGLCYQCHRDFTKMYANVHGPVASGNCTKCHNQHSSKYDKLLTRQGQDVCTYCHNPSLIFRRKVHKDIEDAACTLCHNPHGSNNAFMVRKNIPRDANRIGLMSELTSRHLYGQIFCKQPGDVTPGMEIKIYDNDGMLVSDSHPDDSGKFILSNLHPGQNYTFKFRNGAADCKINVMDSKGKVLFVIERKKGKYTFDKAAYEAAHDAINAENENAGYLENTTVIVNTDQPAGSDTAKRRRIAVADDATEIVNNAPRPDENKAPGETKQKGKITVTDLPGNETAEETAGRLKKAQKGSKKKTDDAPADTTVYKGKIVVKQLPDERSRIRRKDAGATAAIRKYEQDNITLIDLAREINKFYEGTTVCVLNDSADYLDITPVTKSGKFLLFDFLAFRVTVPDTASGIVSQTIFLNDKMEVIETVNRRISNGRYVYVSNTKEPPGRKVNVQIFAGKENATLFTTIYYEEAKAMISKVGIAELDRVVKYLKDNPRARVFLAAHTDLRGSIGYNQQLSVDREKAAINYLISQGIKKNRISGKGYGKTKPLDAGAPAPASEEAQQKNRRVEVYIKNR